MRRWWMAIGLAGAIAGAGVALASMFAGQQREAGARDIGDIKAVQSRADVVLPLDVFADSPQTARVIAIAGDLLGQACMRRLGIEWTVADRSGPYPLGLSERRYGLVDLEQAEHGYGLDPDQAARTSRIRSTSEQVPKTASGIWWGETSVVNGTPVPKGGCRGEADRKLGLTRPSGVDPRLVDDLGMRSFKLSQEDRRVLDALDAWSNCMKAAGFAYDRPWNAASDPRWRTAAEASSAGAVAVARADVMCKQKVNLVGIWLAVESECQRSLINEYGEELDLIRKWRGTVATNAERVIADATAG